MAGENVKAPPVAGERVFVYVAIPKTIVKPVLISDTNITDGYVK